ncbi:MAG: TlpA disulfide reductase family protein [Granulosicoccus sp.]
MVSRFPVISRSGAISLAMTLFVSMIFAVNVWAGQGKEAGSAIDVTAPAIDLPGLTERINLEDYRGQVVYVDFWASWCTPCRQSFPWMNDLQESYAEDGLRVLAISLDSDSDDAADFLAATQPVFDIAFDETGKTAEDYKVRGMPSSYVIDRNGKIAFAHIGFRKKDIAVIESGILAVLEE